MYILYRILEEFRLISLEITITVLRILSNIALKSKNGAEQICETSKKKKLFFFKLRIILTFYFFRSIKGYSFND